MRKQNEQFFVFIFIYMLKIRDRISEKYPILSGTFLLSDWIVGYPGIYIRLKFYIF